MSHYDFTGISRFVQANNLLDHRYYTAAQLASSPYDNAGDFAARPFAPVNGDYAHSHLHLFARSTLESRHPL